MAKVVVLLSGGMDSTTLLAHILDRGDTALPLSVNYGQRHVKELDAATAISDYYKVKRVEVALSSLASILRRGASSQTNMNVAVPEGAYDEASMKATVVPNRNMMMLSVAQMYAITEQADWVAYAAHAGDHAIYPDCRREFVDAMSLAFDLCDWKPAKLVAPFLYGSKADIVKIGTSLKVPYELTWTCYKGGAYHCGRCGTCVERLEAFALAGVEDPLSYNDRAFWKTALAGRL